MYHNSYSDVHGFIHSIDNVIIDYYLVCGYKTVTDRLLTLLSSFRFDQNEVSHTSGCKLDMLPSFRYEYYRNLIWHDGFTFSLGKYGKYDKLSGTWLELDIMRLKVNPNKHDGTDLMESVLKFVKEWCKDGYLVRYDYAVDIKCPIDDVIVIGSRKEKGLYKGTRYLGQRHKHGYCKIYDKKEEQKLSYDLTRIEYTFCGDSIPVFDDILIRAPVNVQNGLEPLSGQADLYLDMLIELKALGADIEHYLQRINYRTRKKIEPYLYTGISLKVDDYILDYLLQLINDKFILTDVVCDVNADLIYHDGFMKVLDTDLPLPFDC